MSYPHFAVKFMAAVSCAVLAGLPALLLAADEPTPSIPLKRVVMFSSGVAFFERGGEIEGNANLELKFHVKDINDLLKSMVLQDLGGGRISTVSYGSKDPITRTLATFAIDLTTNPTLADLLGQIRGETVEIDAPNKIVGTIVGVEKRKVRVDAEHAVETSFVNLLTEDGLRSVSLESVGRIKLANPKLDAELRQALTILAMSHSTDKKSVTLGFTGQGKRPVRVGYIQESPVWKTSYRLVLDDEAPPLLQGWAIVENTTEEDWKNVSLTLVSGRPISFMMDLYQPLYVNRPLVQQELYASLRPRTYDQDLAKADRDFQRAGEAGERQLEQLAGKRLQEQEYAKKAVDALARNRAYLADEKAAAPALKPGESVRSVAQAADVGEMFQYQIATPVELGRQRSAMLPIVNDSIKGEKVSIYNAAVHAKHPLNGLRFRNSTDLHLMQGPITVFDDGAYAGDAQIQDLPPGTERLISYAMDLDTEVAPTTKGEPQQLLSVKLIKGLLHISNKYGRTQSYVVKNSGKKAKNVLVEYPLDNTWTLVEPKEASEKTRDQYRFTVEAQPGKPATLSIREERTVGEQLHVNNLDDNAIRFYINAKVVSDEIKKTLAEIIKRKAAISVLAAKRTETERQINVIFAEQTRIRDNMAQLPKDSDLFRRYVKKFNDEEDLIETLRKQVQDSLAEEAKLKKSLDDYLLGLDLA